MRGAKGDGCLMKLKGCRLWYAQYYRDGKRYRVSTKTEVRAEAMAVLRKLTSDRDHGLAPLPEVRKLTYANLRAGLLANYEERGNRMVERADGTTTVMGLPQLDEFFRYDEENPGPSVLQITTETGRKFVEMRKAAGAGNAVINRSLACLRRMLRIAKEEGKIPSVPVIRMLKEPPARRGFVPRDQFDALLRNLPTHLRPLVLLLYWCGVRLGEALSIEWDAVDLRAGVVRLHETKNGEPRTVPLPSELLALLREIEPKVGRVFDATNLRKEWMTGCVAAGLGRKIEVEDKPYDRRYEGLTIHDLRRSAARNLREAGVPETLIMRIGGWKTMSVFFRYAIASETDLTAAMRRAETYRFAEEESVTSQGNGSSLGKKKPRSVRKSMMALSSRG
ncbi:MAG TPA: site-specific integrase [Terriglobales bacterium]|nr:site-specific integrase [Terriglobales bacterium]